MKKRQVIGIFGMLFAVLILAPMISAIVCGLDVSLINQDPYPAIPGEYADVVFQITGVDNPECGIVTFEIKEDFPFSLDPGTTNPITIRSGVYDRKYSSFYTAPYSIRIDGDAIDGNNPIEVGYSSSKVESLKEFNINIEDSRVDFEIFVKDYDIATNIITFEILNIGDNDVEALTVEIPKQDTIDIKGANRDVIGDLDSNDYTTAEFEATSEGGEIKLEIIYTDTINVRRSTTKIITYNPKYFEGRKSDENGTGIGTYIIVLIILGVIGWWWIKRRAKKKQHRTTHNPRH